MFKLFRSAMNWKPRQRRPKIRYFGRTDYIGPGLVCGSTFSFMLEEGETAVETKAVSEVSLMEFNVRQGEFSIYESLYTTLGGELFQSMEHGSIFLTTKDGHFRWVYRDSAPGSTDVFGSAVDSDRPTPAFLRIIFGPPEKAGCLKGVGSNERSEVPLH